LRIQEFGADKQPPRGEIELSSACGQFCASIIVE
jgi:hypothetical protein